MIPSESAVPVESEPQDASASSESEIDHESGENVAALQARLDAEMQKVEARLGEEESTMLRLVNAETDQILDEIADMRRRALPLMPERLEKIMQVGIDGGISSVFLRAVRELRARSASLPAGTRPSDEWKESARVWLTDQMDSLVDVYDEMRTAASELVHATRASEAQMIQASVAKIRAQSRVAARTFYDVMEEAEFQLTYYEFEGWDSGMKRRGRFFRESVMESLDKMSILGDERQDAATDLNAESALLGSAIDDLFKGMEQGLNGLTDRLLEDPTLLHDRTSYAQLLLDLHEHLDALSATGHEIAVNSTLRMRDLIFDVRESLNMTRIPDEGLLRDVAHLPPLVPLEDGVATDPTTEPTHPDTDPLPTSSMEEEAAFATILPVDDELVREAKNRPSSLPVSSDVTVSESATTASSSDVVSMPFSAALPIETAASSTTSEALNEAFANEAESLEPASTSSNTVETTSTAQAVHETTDAIPPSAATAEATEQEALQPTRPIDPEALTETLTPVLAPTSTPPRETADATRDAFPSRILTETPSITEVTEPQSGSATPSTMERHVASSTVDATPQEPASPPTHWPSTTMARIPRHPTSHSQSADVAFETPRHDEL